MTALLLAKCRLLLENIHYCGRHGLCCGGTYTAADTVRGTQCTRWPDGNDEPDHHGMVITGGTADCNKYICNMDNTPHDIKDFEKTAK